MIGYSDWPPLKMTLEAPSAAVRQFMRDMNQPYERDGLRTLVASHIKRQGSGPVKRTAAARARTPTANGNEVWQQLHPMMSPGIRQELWKRSAEELFVPGNGRETLRDWKSASRSPDSMFHTLRQLHAGREFVHKSLENHDARQPTDAANLSPQLDKTCSTTQIGEPDKHAVILKGFSNRIEAAFDSLPDMSSLPFACVGTPMMPTEMHPTCPSGVVSPLSRFTPQRKAHALARTTPAPHPQRTNTPQRKARPQPGFVGRNIANAPYHKPMVATMSSSYSTSFSRPFSMDQLQSRTLPEPKLTRSRSWELGRPWTPDVNSDEPAGKEAFRTPCWPPQGSVTTTSAVENTVALNVEFVNFGTPRSTAAREYGASVDHQPTL